MTKQPVSCSLRKVRRLSAVDGRAEAMENSRQWRRDKPATAARAGTAHFGDRRHDPCVMARRRAGTEENAVAGLCRSGCAGAGRAAEDAAGVVGVLRHRGRRRDHREGQRHRLAAGSSCARACCATSSRSIPASACSARRCNTPIMVAPTGRHHLFHAEGERATARGAAAAGALYVMSTSGATTVEDVAKESGGAPQWFQLYMQPDRDATGALLDRCVQGRLPRAGAHRRSAGAGLEPARLSHAGDRVARRAQRQHGRPADRAHRLRSGAQGRGDVPDQFPRSGMAGEARAMPVVVKGVLRGDDALRCIDCGVKGIMVSNHGGRHLDTTVTTAEVIGRDRRRGRPERRGLCRRRHPARHRHRQGAGARRARGAGRAAAAVGPERRRRRRRAGGDGASARRDWCAPCSSAARRASRR